MPFKRSEQGSSPCFIIVNKMSMRYLGFVLLVWMHGVLHAQDAAKSCSAPKLAGGYFVPVERNYPPGAKITYACDDRLKPVVEDWWATSTCENGTWVHEPQCIDEQDCISPTIPNGHNSKNSTWYKNESVLRTKCNSGYEHKDRVTTAKCVDGNWLSLPICQKSTTACGQPPKVPHAVIIHQRYQEVFPADSEVQYKCEDGYATEEASSSKSIYCIAGNWDEVPTCTYSSRSGSNTKGSQTQIPINNCGRHPTIENGDVVEIADMFLRFRCNSFYRRVGPEKVTCDTDRTWSDEPMCEAAYCSLDTSEYPDLIPDGVKFIKDGDRVELKCVKKHWRWVTDHYSLVQCINGKVKLTKCCGYFERNTNTCWGPMTESS
ncbi:complement factor H-related protein 1-like isoform X2 [Seriola dumerili]|uniref:complement factor H-related protein 1-like isoform X2 n=1 Tax=Seriola dumerili TaxID=41447 RepID=UPI000BBE8D63|nr:complement factor H-related protein 1-like isoform X2 [Seriola dumerili]